jgi:hypothetical protein
MAIPETNGASKSYIDVEGSRYANARSTGLLGSAEEPRNLLCLEEDLHDPSKFGPKDGRDDAARQGGGRAAGEGSIEGKVPLGPAGGAACFACMKKPKRPVDS